MKKRNELILILVILALALCTYIGIRVFSKPGSEVVITVDGEEYGTYPLNKNAVITVETPEGTNVVTIQDKTVRVAEADCPDLICVNTPALTEDLPGLIVCLPHLMLVQIVSPE